MKTAPTSPGANGSLTPWDIDAAEECITKADVVLLQLESPMETVLHAARLARKTRTKVILNPAPAQILPGGLLECVDVITPNESEAALLTGRPVRSPEDACIAAEVLRDKAVASTVITLGAQGAWICTDGFSERIPAPRIDCVDTTAAGDTFNGALAVGLAEGMDLRKAVELGNRAAALSVQRPGAQASAPHRHELTP